MSEKIKVLIVDDSALIRSILSQGLNRYPDIEVVGTAGDPYQARDKIIKFRPDVLTLDVEMPRMDGVEFLRKLMPQYPIPVVMVSALTEKGKRITIEALEAGAVDFVPKPKADVARALGSMMTELYQKVKAASKANVSYWRNKSIEPSVSSNTPLATVASKALAESTDKVIAIGASTGGTEAIKEVITKFPATIPGVVIVQHMPAGFTKMFAERMNSLCAAEVKEAEHGDRIFTGRILIAPGGKHLKVIRSGGLYMADVKEGELICGHCPSVEVLMQSVARYVGANAIGVILTGMGKDGATGMKALHDTGAFCIAQDEATSVVFGMPGETWKIGGADKLVPLPKIADEILNYLHKQKSK